MDYKHGVVETQRHGLVLVVSPLVALMLDKLWIGHAHSKSINVIRFTAHLCASFLSLRNNFHFKYARKQCVPGLLLPQFQKAWV